MDRKGRGGKGVVRVLVGKAPGHLELVVKVRVRIYQALLFSFMFLSSLCLLLYPLILLEFPLGYFVLLLVSRYF